MTFIEKIRSMSDYIGSNGRTEEEISMTERSLGVSFANDYREYLQEIGLACFDGHELTGICKSARLNVVDVTLFERENFPDASKWYVIEEANIDGIVIWQAPTGEIYQTAPGWPSRKLCDSLLEFVSGE